MASINDKAIIDKITSNKGVYEAGGETDPPVTHIIEYGNMFDGRTTYALAWSEAEFLHQWQTGFFAWKRLYWTLEDGFGKNNIRMEEPTKEFIEALTDYCQDYYKHYDGYPVEFEYKGKVYPYEYFIRFIDRD